MTKRKGPVAGPRPQRAPTTPAKRRPPPPRVAKSGEASSFDALMNDIDWGDIKLFLDVTEAGSIRAGHERTGVAINTIRDKLALLEKTLGNPVVRRTPKGLKLTKAGQELALRGRRMRLVNGSSSKAAKPAGGKHLIRIAATEGLGTYWLMPRLVEFENANPDIRTTLICSMQKIDMESGEFDLAIQLEPPENKELRCIRLGTMHVMPFVADAYVDRAGKPESIDDWPNHKLVWQEADQVASQLLPFFIGTTDFEGLIGITTNTSSAHFRAVASGAGIGLLPTYARAISMRVKPLDIGVHIRREIFCVCHPVRSRSPAVKKAITWLRTAFSPAIYPWFSDTFLHPDEFRRFFSDAAVVSLFEGFIDDIDDDG